MSRDQSSDVVRERATGAILRRAVLSWQTAITLVITLVLFFGVQITNIPFWQQWFWLVLGALAEGAFIVSNLTDPEATQQAIASEFESRYDLRGIKSAVSRQRLQSALEYRRNMLSLVKRHKGAMRLSLQQTVDDINDWIGHMYDLALHIDAFDNNELVERDRRMVPQQLDKARIRLERERDPDVRRELELQIQQLEQQLSNLDATVNSVKRAEIQLESTLSSLGTIYAQMSLLGTKEVDSARAQRLRLEIQDEVASLQDTIDAMAEVQTQRLTLR
ncbi:MAG: hypothetical protein HXY41_05875 [Chloroflexi bacterium]|nr:hypothetical protein [Chloroflexota bacterium]